LNDAALSRSGPRRQPIVNVDGAIPASRRRSPIGGKKQLVAHVPSVAVSDDNDGFERAGAAFANGSIAARSCVRGRPEVTIAANASTSMPLEKLSPCPNRTAARSEESWSY
jgi:hypothetical protein